MTRLLQYLKNNKTCGIEYGKKDLVFCWYWDRSWTDNLYNQRLKTRYVFILDSSLIFWKSWKQVTVSTFTFKIEYIAWAKIACETVWLCGLLNRLEVLETRLEDRYPKTILPLIAIFADNQEVIKLTENEKYYGKIKHIFIKYYKTREFVKNKVIQFE